MVCVGHDDAQRTLAEPTTFVVSRRHVPDAWRLVEDHGEWATARPLVG